MMLVKPIRKNFPDDIHSPIQINYRSTKEPAHELPDHSHNWYELVYVYKGIGRFLIHYQFYDMREGDLFLIPANTIHRAFPDDQDPITSTAIFFRSAMLSQTAEDGSLAILHCFAMAKKHNNYRLRLNHESQSKIMQLIEELQLELSEQKAGFEQAILIQLQYLLLTINRVAVSPELGNKEESAVIPLWMKTILPYIDNHLHENIHLSSLSKQACVSPAHFSRVFKKWTGMNVTDYIVSKRVARAKEQLITTEEKIEQIAVRCGFESTSYFYKMFKKLTHVTPTTYKKIHRHHR